MNSSATTHVTDSTCWSCQAATDSWHFCRACGKIQPLLRCLDYFSFLGLPRKLVLDCAALEQRFHELSWKLHPDHFVRASEYERELSLERSARLNDAYRALRDPIRRAEYLLACEGMRKEGQQKQQAPPELLEEVFALNESLDELRRARRSTPSAGGDGGRTALRRRLEEEQESLEGRLRELDAELEKAFRRWDAALDASAEVPARHNLMARMNELLNRRSYIRNLVANVQQELAEG